jgi:HAD superfamily hydrolase (TIGR01509 family)
VIFDPKTALGECDTLMLDMDGTLLDLAFDNYIWRKLVPEQYAIKHDLTIHDARNSLFAWFQEAQGDLDWYCLDHWSDRLGLDVLQLHREFDHRIGYLPGALAFLEYVQSSEIRVLMVTNSHRDTLDLKDEITGVASFFDGIHSSHDFGFAKERQEFWHALQEEVGFDPESTMFVDDSQPVLHSAGVYGVSKLVEVTQPDTTEPEREKPRFSNVKAVADLVD